MTALVRRMSALLSQSRGTLLRFSTVVDKIGEKTVVKTEEKPKKTKKRPKQDFTNVEGLKQFFDEENFMEDRVKTGRSWNLDELRIKSNSDLHKLWYVLYKEYNMLLTLEHEALANCEVMPNEERIDRVQISMENLELVVRERNKAYFDLEVGETGEQPVYACVNWMGLLTRRTATQHTMPQRYNRTFNERNPLPFNDKGQSWFLNHYREVRSRKKRGLLRRDARHVTKFLKDNPAADIDTLKEKYPSVEVDQIVGKLRYDGDI